MINLILLFLTMLIHSLIPTKIINTINSPRFTFVLVDQYNSSKLILVQSNQLGFLYTIKTFELNNDTKVYKEYGNHNFIYFPLNLFQTEDMYILLYSSSLKNNQWAVNFSFFDINCNTIFETLFKIQFDL